MEVERLEEIEKKEIQLDKTVQEYFSKYTLEQFNRVINAGNSQSLIKDSNNDDLIDQIEVCNRLWVINGLLEEFKTNDDVEVKINDFLKLKRKKNELIEFLNQKGVQIESIGILKTLKFDINKFHDDILNEIRECFKQFLNFDNDLNISFKNELENGLNFKTFIECCNKFSKGEGALFDLRKIFSEWLGESLEKLHNGLFIIQLNKNDKSIDLSYETTDKFQLNEYFQSIVKYIELFNFIVDDDLETFQFVKPTISKLLLTDVKDVMFSNGNIKELLKSKLSLTDSSIKTLRDINDLLNEWPNESNDLEFWIDDLSTFWVESLVSHSVEDVKKLVKKLHNGGYLNELKELTVAELGGDLVPNQMTNNNDDDTVKKESKANECDNGWDDEWDDGWGDEPEPSEQNQETVKQTEEEEKEGEEDDDDEWDAWADDDVDLNIDTAEPIPSNILLPKQQATVIYKYSGLTKVIMGLIKDYYSNLEMFKNSIEIDQFDELTSLFKSNIKKIMVSILMMIQISNGYPNLVLFYNDYSRVLEELSVKYDIDLTMNFKMASKFIMRNLNECFKSIEGLINEYNKSIWFDDANNINKIMLEFNIRICNKIGDVSNEFSSMKEFNSGLISRNEITLIFKVFNLICDKLLLRNDISSVECDAFIEIINELISAFKFFDINLNQIQSFNKLQQIKSILACNLKEITDKFYDGQFYELETFELIELIKALFVDSPNREDLLMQIQSVREVELE